MIKHFATLLLLASAFLSESYAQLIDVGTVYVRWEPVPDAKSYDLRFTQKSTEGTRFTFKTDKSEYEVQVPMGDYDFQMRSIGKDGTPGKWGSTIFVRAERLETLNLKPENQAQLRTPSGSSKKTMAVNFEWREVSGTRSYVFLIRGAKGFFKRIRAKEPKLTLHLPKGHNYVWKAIPIQQSGVIHETQGKPYYFSIIGDRLATPVLTEQEPDPKQNPIGWGKVGGASSYGVKLYKRLILENDWNLFSSQVIENTQLALQDILQPGEYKLEIVAQSQSAPFSEPAVYLFQVKPKAAEL